METITSPPCDMSLEILLITVMCVTSPIWIAVGLSVGGTL